MNCIKVFYCDVCNKSFASKKSRRNHKKVHQVAACKISHSQEDDAGASHNQAAIPNSSLQCSFCQKICRQKRELDNHISAKHTTYRCEECASNFNNRLLFVFHQKQHKKQLQCTQCHQTFFKASLLKHHIKFQHGAKKLNKAPIKLKPVSKQSIKCFNCNQVFKNRIECNKHLRNECVHLPLEDVSNKMIEIRKKFNIKFSNALRGCMSTYIFTPKTSVPNEKLCLDFLEHDIISCLKSYASAQVMLKWSYYMDVQFMREKLNEDDEDEFEFKNAGFSSQEYAFDNIDTNLLTEQYNTMRNDLINRVEKYSQSGSGWIIVDVNLFKLSLYRFSLNKGGKGVQIPQELKTKHCVINLDSDHCFKWAVLCSLHHKEVDHAERTSSFSQWENEFDFPSTPITSAHQVAEFVNKTKLAIFTHCFSDSKVFVECTYRPSHQIITNSTIRIHLLLYKNHWMAITNLSRLYRSKSYGAFKMCDSCLATFHNPLRYASHFPCSPKRYIQNEIMPTEPLQFKEFNKCVDLSDIVYADMEAILEKCEGGKKLLQKHVPCCVGSYWVSKVEDFDGKYKQFKGPSCIEDFVDKIEDLAKYIFERNKLKSHELAVRSCEEMQRHELATECMWCHIVFEDDAKSLNRKVFEHCHLTGKYRGPACQRCNNKLRQDRKKLIIAFHNFRGYDSHGLCLEGFARKPNWVLRPIAQNSEKYLSLTASIKIGEGNKNWMQVRFIDTLQIINCSLSRLAENLLKGTGNYKMLMHAMALKENYPELKEQDIAAKGIFPYSYINSWEKLEETSLPPYEEFYDELEERIATTQEEYVKAQEMFKAFKCKTLFDYQLRYMELDCRLLADVFETFRRLTKVEDALDAAHFLTVSQLSYASALKKCDIKIELIKIPEMYRDIEACKRGGYAFVNKHYCVASNPYVNPDKTAHTKDDVYLGDIDANNLYGNALRYPLPVRDFKYLEEEEYKDIDWHRVQLDGDTGYFVVCDLHYPADIHNKTKNLPLALEVMEITEDMLPEYFKNLNTRKNLNRNPNAQNPGQYKPTTKLLATCYDKKEYVVHFSALQLYINYGLQITKIHRVISFYQAPVFRDYIDYNSNRRKESMNEFEKDFYKQKNNSLFGKSLENKRNRCDYHLCNNPKSLLKATSQHRFITTVEFSENLVAAQMTKANIELNAPIAIGAAILDISKTIMYKIAYDNFPLYERLYDCKLNIVGGDTDSLFFEAIGVDLQSVLYPKMFEDGLLDTSNYDITNPIFSNLYKAKLGCIKDEFGGKPCKEFVLLRPKSYSMKTFDKDLDKKKSKGVPRRKIKALQHDDFRKVLFNQTEMSTNCRRMQSISHVVYNVEQNKIALSYADDKRAWFSNNFSLPYGHFQIVHYNTHSPDDVTILPPDAVHLPTTTTTTDNYFASSPIEDNLISNISHRTTWSHDDVWLVHNNEHYCAPHAVDRPCSSRCKRHSTDSDNLTIKRAHL